MTVSDKVVRAIEKTLLKTQPYIDTTELFRKPFSQQLDNKAGNKKIFSQRKLFEDLLLQCLQVPMSTSENKRLFCNSRGALAFIENGHGISLADFPSHYTMVFDLTSTQEATHDFIHPELTNSSLSVELKFGAALANDIEILFFGRKMLNSIHRFCEKCFQKLSSYGLMDEDQKFKLIQ